MSKLTAIGVKRAKPGRHGDGGGLYLVVSDTGSRKWVLRFQVNGKRHDIGLGSATSVSLADAREAAEDDRLGSAAIDYMHNRIAALETNGTPQERDQAYRLLTAVERIVEEGDS